MKNKPCPKGEWKELQKPRPKKRRTRKKLLPVKVMSDGREIFNLKTAMGEEGYRYRTLLMAERQGFRCGDCGFRMLGNDITFDHENGRGAGKQDDRIEVDGVWQNAALHLWCNSLKGSKRIPYLKHAVNVDRNGKFKR